MKMPKESCKIIFDKTGEITDFVCSGLGEDTAWIDKNSCTIGFVVNGKLIGGLIYHNIRPHKDLWLTIYTTDKRWCTRRALRTIFGLAFNYWQVERVSVAVSVNNYPSIKLVEKLGFKKEGLLRKYRDDGSDCYFFGMLKA